MITAAQLRAARGLVDWTRNELAKAANVSPETVKNIEHGIFRPQEETADRIVKTFAAHGVEFTESEGVRLHKDSVTRYEGVDGFKQFMDEVYAAAQEPDAKIGGGKQICVSNVDDRLFVKHLGDYSPLHSRRMNELKDVKVRVLVADKDLFSAPEPKYIEYRGNPIQGVGNVPFYVYGDKLAILMFGENSAPQIVVISSALVSKAYREQFEILWKNSKTRGRAGNIK
jgi:DNA-binding XRE family transcriptional regulator